MNTVMTLISEIKEKFVLEKFGCSLSPEGIALQVCSEIFHAFGFVSLCSLYAKFREELV